MSLINQIADGDNIYKSFFHTLTGKRNAIGAQKVFINCDFYLSNLRKNILSGIKYPWGTYREFMISDPKKRLVSSAPFIDRVAHRAIYNILEPILDKVHSESVFACRKQKGNGHAVRKLCQLTTQYPEFWTIKLDVKKYFRSINHRRLMAKMLAVLPDHSIWGLLRGLMLSHPDYRDGTGLPLGNLTSQIFANFYLHEIDKYVLDIVKDRYIRYMDDLLILTKDKNEAREIIKGVVALGKKEKLHFPSRKRVWIAPNNPVPFLGFRVLAGKALGLARNKKRYQKAIAKKIKQEMPESEIYKSVIAHNAWEIFPNKI